ncbi:MAG: hypothetical protein HQK53_08840 [Oligoflexia bacterium]|nr:hypothetical protein [Oligoflexia bacterium]
MKYLILNSGSSSLKFQLINAQDETLVAKGIVEKIGSSNAILKYKAFDKNEIREVLKVKNHDYALELILKNLTDSVRGVIKDISQIDAVGHRVVHGGEYFSNSVIINEEVINKIKECSIFAPLHNPPNLMGIESCKSILPNVQQVAVFDTAFHQQIPSVAYLYGLPYAIYEKLKIRRYGFHGTSHSYVSTQALKILSDLNDLNEKNHGDRNIITCHLGNGASVAAIVSVRQLML